MTSGGAAALLAAFVAMPPPLTRDLLLRAAALVAITAAAELVNIRLRHSADQAELITLFELALVADIVLLPVSLGAAVAVAGLGVALVILRRNPVKAVFNLGQYALAAVGAAAVYEGVGRGQFHSLRGVVGLALGMTVFAALNLLTISAILAATTGRPLPRVLAEEGGLSMAMGIGNAAVGIVAVELWLTRPVLLPAVLGPAFALHLAFRGWVKEKELLAAMEEEKTKLERIVEHSSEGIVLAGADGTVMLWSPSMERITGIAAAEAEGKALPFLLRGRGHFGQSVQVNVSTDPEPVELEIVRASGESRWLRVQHGAALDADGALALDVLVIHDVTRQREVDRLKEDFVSTVSHELRTPLTPIKGYASLLLRRGDEMPDERRKEALQSILERSDHMARLVEDLLLASRIAREDRRLPEVTRRPFDMVETVEKVLRSFRLSHPHRYFDVDAPPALQAVGDALRVEQVVANLVSNAVKFSEEGSPVTVTVGLDDGRVRLDVRDEGRGIPSDRFDEIFEKFKRLEDHMVMETGGAGLGLFIVRQLVRAMEGDVRVESEVGQGSTFSVWLPAADAQSAAPPVHGVAG